VRFQTEGASQRAGRFGCRFSAGRVIRKPKTDPLPRRVQVPHRTVSGCAPPSRRSGRMRMGGWQLTVRRCRGIFCRQRGAAIEAPRAEAVNRPAPLAPCSSFPPAGVQRARQSFLRHLDRSRASARPFFHIAQIQCG